jgi:muramoyltetrapeptide carboxypeptidase LdcA involved in peptidoglycan recycling
LQRDDGCRLIQGEGIVSGELFGGCIEVLDFLKGTDFWPSKDFWDGKILFFEISEAKIPVEPVKWTLRNYGVQGIFDKVAAILFGRPRDYSTDQRQELDAAIKEIVGVEFERPDLPVMTNMDFGHTDPQIVLPLGVKAELDCESRTLRLIEPWLD